MRGALLLALALFLSACSVPCEHAGVVGVYGLDIAQVHYELRLDADESGALIRDEVEIAELQWELEPSNGQVSIRSNRQALEMLRQISGDAPFPTDVAGWKSGYRGMTPKCGPDGAAKRLDLDVDGQKYFARLAG